MLSLVVLALIILAIALKNKDQLPGFFDQVGLACLFLCGVSTVLGYGSAKLARLTREDQVTIALEVGIQNGTTGLFIALTLLSNDLFAIPAAVYSLVMFGVGGGASYFFSKLAKPPSQGS